MKYIGLDIGGTKCAATLADVDGEIRIMDKKSFLTDSLTPEEVMDTFASFIEVWLNHHTINGIGISCGGPLNSHRGIIMKPPSLPLWDNITIVEYFENRFNIKTYLQNDANAGAVAEWKYGAGKGYKNLIFLTFGTGLGAGLILNNQLYVGTNDNAGEIGHVRLTTGGPIGYNKAGSCEGYCSGSGITRLAKLMAKREKGISAATLIDAAGGEDGITTKLIAELAKKGDRFCLEVFRKSGEMFGRTLSILIDMINPEIIIVGGVFMRCAELLMPHAERAMEFEALELSRKVCKIVPAGLGEAIGDVSAIAIAKGDF